MEDYSVFLKSKSLFPIQEIEWWLLKYAVDYKNIKDNWICEYCPMELGLPCCCKSPSYEGRFLELYNELDNLTKFHRFEKYAKEQLDDYAVCLVNKNGIKKWLSKNEKFGGDILVCFFTDYLEYSEKDEENINLLAYRKKDMDVFVERKYFKNLIEFKELFDELYYAE
jgi:hypothetical protein